MLFKEQRTLVQAGSTEQIEDMELDSPLLVGMEIIHSWENGHTMFGCNWSTLKPAYFEGKRCWLRTDVWKSSPGYSCDGLTNEEILTEEYGFKVLNNSGYFSDIFEGGQ